MTERTLVTIGITAFNAADTIARAVNSAVLQTWRPIEIVVVDDCSSDETPNVLADLAAMHSEIRVLRHTENSGAAPSRNRIIAEAKGEFIAFFDDDDWSDPERVAQQTARILAYEHEYANGSPVICHTAREQHFPDGSKLIIATMGCRENHSAPAGWPVAERILIGNPLEDGYGACATCSQMARTSFYRDLDGFDPEFRRSEDSEFTIRAAKAGGHFVGIGAPLVEQTMTRSSDKSLSSEGQFFLKLLEKHRDVPDRYGLYDFCREWLDFKQAWLEGRWALVASRAALLALRHPFRTSRRVFLALPNRKLNATFGRFHRQDPRAN